MAVNETRRFARRRAVGRRQCRSLTNGDCAPLSARAPTRTSGNRERLRALSDDWILQPCPTPSAEYAALAVARQESLTKPQGSLGTLEALAVKLASLQATERPKADIAPIISFAGDHGVTAQGISAYPAAV